MSRPLHLGFACVWDRNGDRARTWSHTPLRLWEALERRSDVVLHDLPVRIPDLPNLLGWLTAQRLVDGRRFSTWRMRPWYARLAHAELLRTLRRAGPMDAVLGIGELGPIDPPLFIYQDHHYAHGLDMYRSTGILPYGWEAAGLQTLERRAAHQNRTFATAAGVFTMSQWNANHLINTGLVPANRVHVVHAGLNVSVQAPTPNEIASKRARPFREVLFVGREFMRKGGDLVVEAIDRARALSDRPLRLIVAGPAEWPASVKMPDETTFLGDLPMSAVRERLRSADVLVMPSRFEAFGIIFIEALASGTPAIGRNAFAMPEMIDYGINGMLVNSDDPSELAAAIATVVADDAMADRCAHDAPRIAATFSWDRVADDMIAAITKAIR